jgi:type 1 glutamine amidotransferase
MNKIKWISLAALCAVAILTPLCGKETWEERAAARLKPLTDDQKRQITRAIPKETTAQPQKAHKILVFWRSEEWIHISIPSGNFALQEMGRVSSAFTVDLADDYEVFTTENLRQYDAIVFNNTTHLKLPSDSHRAAIKDFIESGKGIAGIHAATDNFYEWKDGADIMGGQFCGHPWTADGTYAFKLDDPEHRLNKAFHGRGFWHKDEIYQYDPDTYQGEENLRILVSLDMSKPASSERLFDEKYAKHNAKFKPGMREVPVSWVSTHGKGRLFNTNFGHNESTYTKPVMMRHLLDGIQYALGDLKADATPTADTKNLIPALAPNL